MIRTLEAPRARGLIFKTKKEFSQKLVNITKNALKHASRPEEQYVLLDPEESVVRVLRAVFNYQLGSGEPYTEAMNRFEVWIQAERPEYLSSKPPASGAAT